jgi:hypothetical protein
MQPSATLEDIKTLIAQLPLQQQLILLEDLEEQYDSLAFMKVAETGFTEWNDPEEDIYNDEA